MGAISTTEVNGFTVEIWPDENASNPHDDMTHGCEMAFSHKRYTLPNDAGIDFDAFGSWGEVRDHLIDTEGALLILPVNMIDHSGLALRVDRGFPEDPGGWDSGQIGWAYVTRQNWADTQGTEWTGSEADQAQARRLITDDVETYGYYLNGETYGYVITDPVDGEEVEACWGIYGFESAEEEANASAASLTHEPKCSGKLDTHTGQVEHSGACALHPHAEDAGD